MLFALLLAEEVKSAIPPEVNSVVNMTALAILGYHLLLGLPKLFEKILDSQERASKANSENINAQQAQFMLRNDKVVEAINQQTEAMTNALTSFVAGYNRRGKP